VVEVVVGVEVVVVVGVADDQGILNEVFLHGNENDLFFRVHSRKSL
jgi:hypothetical protein